MTMKEESLYVFLVSRTIPRSEWINDERTTHPSQV